MILNIKKNRSKILGSFFILLFSTMTFSEEILSDQDLYSDANLQASVSGKAKKGDVSLIEKKGFWVKIKSGDQSGWTKMSNIKLNGNSGTINLADTGRSGSGNIVSTSGARGLDGGDLINSKPDFTEFSKLQALKTTKPKGAEFASSGGLTSRTIKYVDQVK